MRRQPASVSLLDRRQLEDMHIGSLKGASALTPNFFMPDYGSRLSSAVYIRGIGSRINSPAIGLYIDDVPVLDKSAFDFGLYDMQRLDILRGPQTTLYGSGTMGGVMKVYSRSPFDYQGTEIGMGYATRDNSRKVTFSRFSKASERFAWSFGGFYQGGDGFFYNDHTGEKIDFTSGGGIRARFMLLTRRQWMLDMGLNFEISNEGAYPYYYKGRADGQAEDHPDQLDRINSNINGLYDRNMVRTSMNAAKKFSKVEVRSITSLQHLKDTMQMDQDFLSNDIYKLAQVQRNFTLTEDLLLKSRKPGRWQWISGLSASMMHSRTKAPVTFRQEGIDMLNGIINQNANTHMPVVQAGPMSMKFMFDDQIQAENLLFDNKFTTLDIQTGAFHQSTFHELFGVRGLNATVALRFNAETQSLRYASWYDFTHRYKLNGLLTMPSGNKEIPMVTAQDFHVVNGLYSSNYGNGGTGLINDTPVRDTHLELMPRIALHYDMEGLGNIYATVSRGYRSGGYNLQNISEVMRSLMTRDMMQDIRDVSIAVLQNQPQVPSDAKDKVAGILNAMAGTPDPDVAKTCTYNPEYAWNYEVGTHLNLLQGHLSLDASAYLSDIRDLQLSQMSETGLGRIMVNAGKSRSAGMELTMKARPVKDLVLQANYGYTHAVFREYSDYDANTNSIVECDGNYVPFMPLHTMNVDASYTVRFKNELRRTLSGSNSFLPVSMTFGANVSGAGRIYWTEQNDASQDFYSTLGARVSLDMHPLVISLWGRNLTNTRFNTFWFVSGQRAYEQHGKPVQVGLDAKLCF